MKISHAVSFIAFGLIVAYAVYYIAELGVRVGPPDDRVNVAMQVPDINGLVVDSNVLLRGVPVGKVTGIDTTLQSATVHFYIDKQYPIPVDSDVRLENLSALGESYIGLVPRTSDGPVFHDGQQVATQNVTQPASISELASSVVRVLNQMDPGQLNRLVDETDKALPPTNEVLPNLTRASILLRDTANGMQGRGSEMLANVQTLLADGAYIGPALSEISPPLLATGTPLYRLFWAAYHVVTDTGAPESIKNFGRLLARVQNFLDTRGPDIKVYAQALMPNIQAIGGALMNVDTGQILTNMLDAIPEDGTITLRVMTPGPPPPGPTAAPAPGLPPGP
ncbi:MAG: phospholipid/cholesterol/gamma-HCH transport system substrate-binding protein [Mycobacterium sp.]|nr:phospholipid/cholesterol/gamma-HCH transport system substrate-binding protein [Mycobacterium sp.]MDT5194513.1 phospholipid/cholesterol/gamma-HCH transport system substrate-binding protein [Mycobacterium sp.]MDT5202054.1 phospholipid/cholesterol/gamma-HCH transport system substrate-binding protein [Mycobacterium sp.]MDT5266494.1 phospholipid/cholesterol/gamma-HCH transport system substrate-binding protein [Mycobacterium sp.]MDT5292204.1 phospholipid/cholesterol/gamma-HCH transport system subs